MKRLISCTALGLAATALAVGGLATSAQAAPAVANGGDPALTDVYIWATDVNLRQQPTTDSPRLAQRSQWWADAICQTQGQTVHDPAVGTNNWWTAVMEFSGSDVAWVNNLYIRGGEKIAGVPDC
ncbi:MULTISPECIES: peptidase M23 [Streptomyces]|uniref:Peptidase M23 n=1 Tax=Streptomyces levis TaxID=285566 RepID=A0ABN3P0N9_9ACTN|nr:peptidase M23 [Streptomyces sp. XY006]OXS35480.1 peptidase M23 [Streptomyces sp. XY006]